MRTSEKLDQIIPSIIALQAEIRPVKAESKNPFFNSTYADLGSVWSSVHPLLAKNGLCVISGGESSGSKDYLETTIFHSSGQWVSCMFPIVSKDPNDPQKLGSAITYLRRYSLCSLLGVVTGDDDGEGAMSRQVRPEQPLPGDGNQTDISWRFNFGKWRQRTIEELYNDPKVGRKGLEGYINFLNSTVTPQKPQSEQAKEAIKMMEEFIGAMENKPLYSEQFETFK